MHCAKCSQHHCSKKCPNLSQVAYLHLQVAVLVHLVSMFPSNVSISKTAVINKKTSCCLHISKRDVTTTGTDYLSSTDGCMSRHSNAVCLHKTINIMSVQVSIILYQKQNDNKHPVNNGDHLIASISVFHY